jgi:ABC-type xylose transport system permease subunit
MSEQVTNTQKQNAEPVDARKTDVNKVSLIFSKMGIYAVLIMLVIVGLIVSKGQFFAASNIQSILEAVSLVGMVAAGALYVTYSGNMCDMSIPMTMAMGRYDHRPEQSISGSRSHCCSALPAAP